MASRSVSGAVSHLTRTKEGERWTRMGGKRCNWRSFQSHYKDSPQRSSSTLSLYWWLNGPECFQIASLYPNLFYNNKKKEEIGLKISLPSLHFATILFSLYRFVWIEHQNKRPEGKRREKFLEALFVFLEIGCRNVCCAIMPTEKILQTWNRNKFLRKCFFIHKTGPLINSLLESTKDGFPRETWKLSENPSSS